MTIEEIKIKRCEIGFDEVVYEGEMTLDADKNGIIYLGVGLYADVWGFEITKNSNYLYRTEGQGEEDGECIESYQSREEMSKNSKYRKYFNILVSQIAKLAKSNEEYCD